MKTAQAGASQEDAIASGNQSRRAYNTEYATNYVPTCIVRLKHIYLNLKNTAQQQNFVGSRLTGKETASLTAAALVVWTGWNPSSA